MPFLTRNQIILAKIEATYGTDPVPTGGANAILTKNLQRTMYGGNRIQRDLNYPYMANDHSINTAPMVTLTFDVELAGSGTVATAPQFGPLLRACGLDETIVALTSVTYAPISASFESVTIYYNYDGEQQKIVGARGTAVINMARGQIPTISFTFTGKYQKPTAVALPSPTYTAGTPLPFNNTNTTTFQVSAQAVYGESFSLDLGCNVVHRNLSGFDGVLITDRNPTGSALFEAVTLATKDYFAAVESHAGTLTEAQNQVVHGTAAGNIVTLTTPTAQLSDLSEQESDGIRMYNAPFIPLPTDAGNDEFSLAFT